MERLAALINLVAGALIALAGSFVVFWCGFFLRAVPRAHMELAAWAFCLITVGLYLFIAGVGRVRMGAVRLQDRRIGQDDYS